METKIKFLENRTINHLLDIACGGGYFSGVIGKSCKEVKQITGIDINADNEDNFLKTLENYNPRFIEGSIGSAGLPLETYDAVSISLSLHHIEGIDTILAGLSEKLKKGALLIVFEMISDDLTPQQENQKDFHQLFARLDKERGVYHRNVYSLEEIKSLVHKEQYSVLHEDLVKNDTNYQNMDEVLPKLEERINEGLTTVFGSGIPGSLRTQVDDILNNIREKGFAAPPIYLYIGEKK